MTTAVKFLSNPNVQRCTLESKERFLRSKGLTDPEIQKAIAQCSEMVDLSSMTSELFYFHGRKYWLRNHVIPLLVYGGFAYGCYWFYKVSSITESVIVSASSFDTMVFSLERMPYDLIVTKNIPDIKPNIFK